jgi:hypothetical protein
LEFTGPIDFFTTISSRLHPLFIGPEHDGPVKPSNPSIVPSFPPEAPASATSGRLLQLFASAVGLTLLSNFLLWPATPGLSWGLFIAATGTALALNRPHTAWSRTSVLLFALLLLTAGQSAVEISFSNGLVSLALLVALVGEVSYPTLASGWERGSEALWALAKAPGRWGWLADAVAKLAWANTGVGGTLVRCLRIGLPALILGAIFAGLLGEGNAIFGSWISTVFATFWRWLEALDLSLGHLLFLGLLATGALAVLQPSDPGTSTRVWARTIPQIPVANPAIAWWRSVAILGLLNALFFVVNTIDALYLWTHSSLPAGVNASQYVHEGVNSLIAAVLLSAGVLAALFQQNQGIGQSPALKRLGYVWIAQNFILIAGVTLRLVRYIQDFLLTPQRVYALAFVLLVAAGFVLLVFHIARNRSLNGLILSNGLATLTLFFGMQFLNVAGWVADYNVARWELDARKPLDIEYLESLGSPAWPALARVADSGRAGTKDVKSWLERAKIEERRTLHCQNWRSWQARRAFNAAR